MVRRYGDGHGTLRIPGGQAPPPGGSPGGPADALGNARPPLDVPLVIAASFRARGRGLLGRDGVDGALLLTPCSGVHTFGMRFAIDVAHLDRSLTVRSVRTMRPWRLGASRPRTCHVLEAEAGAMERWGLRPGVRVEIVPGAAPGVSPG